MKKVLVFGIFDDLHLGHISFLRQAKKHGDFLIAAVGRTSSCRQIKCKTPKLSLKQRLAALATAHPRRDAGEPLVDRAVPGDIKQGTYKVILREKPDIICLGYDQKALARDVRVWLKKERLRISLHVLKPYKPDCYHSSFLKGKKTLRGGRA